jgi:phosphate starvation-inducible protein PhoH
MGFAVLQEQENLYGVAWLSKLERKKQVKRIILTAVRQQCAGKTGFLPGDMKEKLDHAAAV